MAKPNYGHKSNNAWNVALWLGNDEGLYRMCCEIVRRNGYGRAPRLILEALGGDGARTPDGGKYNLSTIRAGIVGFVDVRKL